MTTAQAKHEGGVAQKSQVVRGSDHEHWNPRKEKLLANVTRSMRERNVSDALGRGESHKTSWRSYKEKAWGKCQEFSLGPAIPEEPSQVVALLHCSLRTYELSHERDTFLSYNHMRVI